jgi:hypothetical protein
VRILKNSNADSLVEDDHSSSTRNHLPDIGAVLCLMGHMQRNSGDSKRAMDAYVEALKVNPYLWEAFIGLVELGTYTIRKSGVAYDSRGFSSSRKLLQGKFHNESTA